MARNNNSNSNSNSSDRNHDRNQGGSGGNGNRSGNGLTGRSRYFTGALYQRMSDDLHLAGMSQRTHDGYLRAVRQLADFVKRSPDAITEDQLRRFFLHLKNERHFAAGSLRVAFSGVKFFYKRTCRRDWKTLAHMKVPNQKTLPEVITIDQVHQILDHCTTLRMKVYFWTVYSMGLRMSEALNLQVGDIDSDRMLVHVHRGKGAKDRYIPLPSSTLRLLREYWQTHRNRTYVFPADGRNHRGVSHPRGVSAATGPMSETSVQGAMKKITKKIDFGKKVSIHTLRHSYATHLLEAGVSGLRYRVPACNLPHRSAACTCFQQYMGHSSLMTTIIYLHLTLLGEENARKIVEELFRRRENP